MKQLAVGQPAPDFSLQTLDGQVLQLQKARATSPVVLAFYKAGCPTCQLTFPFLQRIQNATIWGISQDDAEETRAFIEQFGIGFPVLIDPHPYDVSAAYGLEFVPGIFVVGMDGIIRVSDYGFSK